MSLEYWKREKNFRALDKGYTRDPEGFPFWFLLKRLREETDELEEALDDTEGFEGARVIQECSDVSNLVDYIASKAASQWPDKYSPEEVSG